MKTLKTLWRNVMRVLDIVLWPFTLVCLVWLRAVRHAGLKRMPLSRKAFLDLGVYPLLDHFYEPQFHPRHLTRPLDQDRPLPGVDFNAAGQLALLAQLDYEEELLAIPRERRSGVPFFYHNRTFGPGDAEILYSLIRHFRPRRVIEIGSGNSSLVSELALARNAADDPARAGELLCIEPFAKSSLRHVRARILAQRVEDVDLSLFTGLKASDILFIDSSHMIRPQGDVLFEYLEVLPRLAPGVLVHVHDIFTPRDYPAEWLQGKLRFWNEQYLLEAFLTLNRDFAVLAALHYLHCHHRAALLACCPILRSEPSRQPGSFWMVRRRGD